MDYQDMAEWAKNSLRLTGEATHNCFGRPNGYSIKLEVFDTGNQWHTISVEYLDLPDSD